MLTIKPLGNAQDALHYYSAKDNYYLKDKESLKESSRWMGKGADKLDLKGMVEQAPFLKLLNGELPNGEVLGISKNGERKHRSGTDVTLSAPKSVSIIGLVLGDEKVIGAHEKAVQKVFDRIEKMAAEARITINRETAFQKTGNLTAASFLHTSSRALDPDLHTHLVILNMTERLDGMWRALSSRDKTDKENLDHGFREIIYQNQHYLGLVYMSTLAKEIKNLGFDIRIKDMYGNFEIEGVPQEVIDHLSKRRDAIVKDMESKGNSSAKAAEVSNGATRQKKEDIDTQALIQLWKDDISAFGIDLETLRNLSKSHSSGKTSIDYASIAISQDAKQAVSDALEHLTEFNTQVKHASLVRQAFAFTIGAISHEEIEQEISHRLKEGGLQGKAFEYYTTESMVQRERTFIESVLKNDSSRLDINDESKGLSTTLLKKNTAIEILEVNGLSNQKDLIKEFVETSEKNKINAYVLHQSKNNAQMLSDELKRESHGRFFVWLKNLFKDDIVHTVAGFKYHHGKTVNANNKQSVIIVHDAQKLSLSDIEQLKGITDSNRGKLILLNNTDSTYGFSVGNPLKTLKENGVSSTSVLSARKHIEVEIAVSKTANTSAVSEQARNIVSGKNTTLVALNNSQKKELTKELREELKNKGFLSIQEKEANVLSTHGLTDAQKKHVKYYSPGDRITFKAFTANQKHYEVINRSSESLILKNEQGKTSSFKLNRVDEFQVSKAEKLSFAIGDLIRNDRALFINRQKYDKDSVFQVSDLTKEGIELKDNLNRTLRLNNETLSKSYLSHAYVKKINQLQKDDQNIILSSRPYQLNRNIIGEMSETAKHITLFTTNEIKARNFFDKEQIKWSAYEVAEKKPDMVYRDAAYANRIIEKDLVNLISAMDFNKNSLNKEEVSRLAVSFAVAKCAERHAAFKHSDLMTHALKYALGTIDFDDIAPVLKERLRDGSLVHMDAYWTTKESLELEKEIIKLNFSEQNVIEPIEKDKNKLLELPKNLTKGQKDAVTLICTSTDRFNSIQGLAGVGKTTMMKEVLNIATQNGYKILGLAPTHQAKDELISNGIGSETIESFLTNSTPIDSKTIIIADEASMIDNLSYHQLQKIIKKSDSRLFFAGDITQLQSLSSGIPHELTIKTKSQNAAHMDEIVRQNPNPVLKKAAEYSSNRELRKAFGELDKINPSDWIERKQGLVGQYRQSVVEIPHNSHGMIDKENPIYEAIANDYLSRTKDCRENTVVVVPAHKDRSQIDVLIREGLKKESEISHIEHEFTRLIAKSQDKVDLIDMSTFNKGDIIRFGRSYHIGKKGEYFKIDVVDKNKNKLHLSGENKEQYTINPSVLVKAQASIYTEFKGQLASGDRIRLKISDENRGLVANKEYQVKSINPEFVLIENGEHALKLSLNDKSSQHWDYAYTNTAYALQGATAKYGIGLELKDNVVVTTHRSHEIINTRPSHHLTIYTDDREGLLERMEDPVKQRDADKKSAVMEIDRYEQRTERQKYIAQNLSVTKQNNNSEKISHISQDSKSKIHFKEGQIDKEALLSTLISRSRELVTHLLGEPNHGLSKPNNYRYGTKGSLSVNLTKGVWYNFETGDKGNLFHLIESEKGLSNFKEVLDFAVNFTNYTPGLAPVINKPIKESEVKHNDKMQKLAAKFYRQSKPIKGSLIEKYLLIHRGISQFDSADIRYCPGIYTKTSKGVEYLPGLLAFARNETGQINHVQVTRLDEETANKTKKCKVVKQTYSANNGFAVNLNHRGEGDLTYYTEGVETGLSLLEGNPKSRVFTVLGKENFGNIKLDKIPTKKVVICVDNDGKATYKYKKDGKHNIIESVERLKKNGFDVLISLPKKSGQDLNDILLLNGKNGLEKEMKSLITLKEFKEICDRKNQITKSDFPNLNIKKLPDFKEININKIINNYDISHSQLIKDLKIESQKIHSNSELMIQKTLKNTIQKDREMEREL